MGTNLDELIILSNICGENNFDIEKIELNKDLEQIEDLKTKIQDQIVDLSEDIAIKTEKYSKENFESIMRNITDASEQGVMFYYGESTVEKDNKAVSAEIFYKPFLLQHTIVGLSVL